MKRLGMKRCWDYCYARMPLTTALVTVSSMVGFTCYGWGRMDGAKINVEIRCGHDSCAEELRSPGHQLIHGLLHGKDNPPVENRQIDSYPAPRESNETLDRFTSI